MNLGDPVTITDHLIRAELRPRQVLALADRWEHMPAPILERARKISTPEGRRPILPELRNFRLWIPASHVAALGFETRTLYRNHPAPHPGEIAYPIAGIVTQRVHLQDGRVVHEYDEGATFIHAHTGTGYRVAYNVNRRPVLVHPTMIEGAP